MKCRISRSASFPLLLWAFATAAQNDLPASGQHASQNFALDGYAVAVIPLKIVSDAPEATEFADVIYKFLNDGVASIDGAYLVDRGLIQPFSGSENSPKEIARAVGAGNVVYGEVSSHNDGWSVYLIYDDASREESSKSASQSARFKPIDSGDGVRDLTEVENRMAEFTKIVARGLFPERHPDQEQVIAEMRARILDASLRDAERVAAVQAMPQIMNAGPGYVEKRTLAFGGPVATALAQIATYSENARLRRKVWNVLTGVEDPNLIAPLRSALANDLNDGVRIEAGLRLVESFYDVPGVREIVEFAAENDPSNRVRQALSFATLSDAEQEHALKATILDADASFNDRWSALRELNVSNGTDYEFDHQIVASAVDLARNTDDARARYMIWIHLRKTNDPYVVSPLVDELQSTTDDDMKSLAISVLARFDEDARVREALELVAARDASMKIRESAQGALEAAGNK